MITTGRPRAEIPFARALNLIYAYGTSAASQMLGVAETTLRKRVAEKGFRIVGGRNLAPLGDPVSKPPATVATRPRVKFQPDKCSPPESCFNCPFPDCMADKRRIQPSADELRYMNLGRIKK